ncbi:MAG: hypothetical protein AAGA53_04000 [Pseudomonadota bacterium]
MIERNSRRIEVFVDQPLLRRIRDVAAEAGVVEYTILPTLGGQGERGRWHDDQVTGGAGSKVILLTYVSEEIAVKFLELLQPLMEEYGLFVASSNSEITYEE